MTRLPAAKDTMPKSRGRDGGRQQRKDTEVAQGDVLLQVMQPLSAAGSARWLAQFCGRHTISSARGSLAHPKDLRRPGALPWSARRTLECSCVRPRACERACLESHVVT